MGAQISDGALDQLFRTARSYNGYLDKPVSETQLRAIWDLLKFGPTSANLQPLRIVWCTSEAAKQKLAEMATATNVDKIRQAPVTAVLGMDMQFYEKWELLMPYRDVSGWFRGNEQLITDTAMRNSSMQGAYFLLAARAIGLDTGPMSGFDHAAVDAAFFAGTPIRSNFISTLGYGDPASLFDRLPRPEFDLFTSTV
ncbi:malonic semialdehyde reductase [Novosphingobium sp. BL-52-GroH]|uniref:malonic semialdehyde reductase n=1 Tax=Novosphingobium sp. BL-52-GroH TaxID=3349877 RepID=UPI00384CB8C2